MERNCLTCRFRGLIITAKRVKCKAPNVLNGGYINRYCFTYEPQKEEPTKMDKQTAIINHRHMWNWLSENPEESKINYLQKHNYIPGTLQGNCFLCQYNKEYDNEDCGKCLLVWPGGTGNDCDEGTAIWDKWEHETNLSHRAELARQIRDLPEREEKRMAGVLEGLTTPKTVVVEGPFKVDASILSRSIEAAIRGTSEENKPSPPPKLTRAEAIAKTREQWRWYGRNTDKSKKSYFDEHELTHPREGCYLCEYVRGDCADIPDRNVCGKACPLKWPGGCCILSDRSGLYNLWVDRKDIPALRRDIAYLISNLPVKKEA